jgi:hypothetical protein
MKKISPTPLARRVLDDQLAALKGDPKEWKSEHLCHAFEIVEKQTGRETAKKIVIEAVRAADHAVKNAAQQGLEAAQISALKDFSKNCRAIANGTKPNRLSKEVRMQLNEAARSAFAAGGADLETVQDFFWGCKKIVERLPQDKAASAIFKHLVTDKDDKTLGKVPLYQAPAEDRIPKIALDYEALPPQARSACESALAQLISEKAERLTAHDVFASLHNTSLNYAATARLEAEPNIIHDYLAELDDLWTNQGLDGGRGNDPADPNYFSPFQEFAERVLLNQRDPRSRLFAPFSKQELIAAKITYREFHRKTREDPSKTSAEPFAGRPLITDWILRTYLDSRSTFKKPD